MSTLHPKVGESCMARSAPNALTIAYMAIGASIALGGLAQEVYERITGAEAGTGGQLDVVEQVTAHALELDNAVDAAGDLFCCVPYEVAEPFGQAYVEALARGETPDAGAMIADLIASCAA
ncbi:hypothetical protein H8Z74_22605 (plasmid) [Xanthomonas citri pv. citri]|nr:hypothetical protein H8Z74_22605 [Xanthomonas citri pv. citri]